MNMYRYPRLVILLLLLIVVAGSAAIVTMPRLEDPHMKNRVVFVLTRFPGAGAERVEALVTERIEKKLREVAEVDVISSTSRVGLSFITVEMKDEVDNVERVEGLLRDKLSEVNDLPEGALPPVFDENRLYAFTAIIGLLWQGGGPPDYAILGRHAEELDTRLRNIGGTDFVRRFGIPDEEITVTLEDSQMAALGLDAEAVAARIFGGDSKNSSGFLSGDADRYIVEVEGELDSLERIRRVPLANAVDSGLVTVGDVATVERTHRDPPDSLALLEGSYGAVIAARMLEDRRVDKWMEEVEAVLANYRATLPENVEARVIFDQAAYTEERLSGLMSNLIYSAIIVVTVLLMTLGWRASLLAGSILPLAALSALAVLNFAGLQIEQMVVTGMIVALGIMVDNAIVVTDEVQTRLIEGARRVKAVARTVRKLWMPLLGSTITTAIAFMPIILMPGNAGEFVGGISASVIAALVASYLISFTIIAAIAGRILVRSDPGMDGASSAATQTAQRRWWREGVDAAPVRRAFRASLFWSVRHPALSMLLASLLPITGLLAASTLQEQFFPPSDRNQFHIELTLPVQASIEDTRRMVETVDGVVRDEPGVASTHWYIGQSAAKFYYNLLTNKDNAANYAQAMVTMSPETDGPALVSGLQRKLDRLYPHAQTLVRELEQGPPFNAPIEVRLHGPDLAVLHREGEEVRRVLADIADVTHTGSTLAVGRPEITVRPDEHAAASIGLSLRDIANQLRGAIDGSQGGSVLEQTEEVPVRVRTNTDMRRTIDGLRDSSMLPASGARMPDNSFAGVPLTAIADVRLSPSVGSIPRRAGERVNTVQGYLNVGVLPETVLVELQRRLDAAGFALPPGYSIDYGGESEERNDAVGKLLAQAGVLGVLMVLAIVLTFNSFRLAAITFASALQSAGLGLLALWVFGYPLGFVVIVGLMGLVGLAINAAIVILSELRGDPGAQLGDDGAIVDGVMATGRHIISTTLTTVGGFMPLILSSSPFWPPFAVAIAGGTLLTMIVSFYFAPAAFKLLLRRRPVDGRVLRQQSQRDPADLAQAAE